MDGVLLQRDRCLLVLQRLGLKHCMLGDADESFLDDAERSRLGKLL